MKLILNKLIQMKNGFIFLLSLVILNSCDEKWDEYYHSTKNDLKTEELSMTLTEFFESRAEYSEFYTLLKSVGVNDEFQKDQLLTVWAVSNENLPKSPVTAGDSLRIKYHVNYLPFNIDNLEDKLRIMTFNGVYLQISITDSIYVNDSYIIKTYKLKNGIVHEISKSLFPKINMFDYIKGLGNDYSIIRDSIMQYNQKVFDIKNSIPNGVDKTGNTTYDSVFYYTNSYFFSKVNIASEFEQFTAFIPSNAVIKACFDTLNERYTKMNTRLTREDTLTAMKWIKEAVFYKGVLTDFSPVDIKSAFSQVWRTTVQKLDLGNPIPCSNGVIYNVTKLKVPNNFMVYKYKSYFHYWNYLPDAEKPLLFKINYTDTADNVISKEDGGAAAGADYASDKDLWRYWCLRVGAKANTYTTKYSLSCPPLEKFDNGGTTSARVMKVQPGEYTLYLGLWSGKTSSAHPYINVYFNNTLILENIQASKSTPWNFDRVNETATERGIVEAPKKFDGLGGPVGTVTIPGDTLTTFEMKIEFSKIDGSGYHCMSLYHWTLKPTSANY